MFELGHERGDLIPVMCCWNNEQENFDGNLRLLQFHEAISLESRLVGNDYEPAGATCQIVGGHKFELCGEQFPFQHHRTWVGNMMWDLIWLKPADALRLLNLLQAQRVYSPDEAVTELFDKWDSGQPFDEADLKLIVECSEGFAL